MQLTLTLTLTVNLTLTLTLTLTSGAADPVLHRVSGSQETNRWLDRPLLLRLCAYTGRSLSPWVIVKLYIYGIL